MPERKYGELEAVTMESSSLRDRKGVKYPMKQERNIKSETEVRKVQTNKSEYCSEIIQLIACQSRQGFCGTHQQWRPRQQNTERRERGTRNSLHSNVYVSYKIQRARGKCRKCCH